MKLTKAEKQEIERDASSLTKKIFGVMIASWAAAHLYSDGFTNENILAVGLTAAIAMMIVFVAAKTK